MNVVALVIDRLHAGYLGALGNTWVGTPSFDRLAAESFTFDQALVDCPTLDSFYRAAWLGRHAAEHDVPAAERMSLPARLRAGGMTTTLATDDADALPWWLRGEVDEFTDLSASVDRERAAQWGDTHLAEVFAAATECLEEAAAPVMLWLHVGSLGLVWDAPLEKLLAYSEPDEPPPPDQLAVPRRELAADFDPDERWGVAQAYAGQVSVLDDCLGGFLEALRGSRRRDDTVLVVIGARGLPLGEHGLIGGWDDALHGELLRMPWFLRLPDGAGASCRTQALVQTPDLGDTLLDAVGLRTARSVNGAGQSLLDIVRGEPATPRDRVCVLGPSGERGIRTPAWYLRIDRDAVSGEPATQLYAMPDDYWETNEVSSRAPDIVEQLVAAADEWLHRAADGTLDQLAALDESLTGVMRS